MLARNNVDRVYRIDDFQSLNKIQKSLTESVYKLTLEGISKVTYRLVFKKICNKIYLAM